MIKYVVSWRQDGKKKRKSFPFSRYKSWTGAYDAAEEYAEEKYEEGCQQVIVTRVKTRLVKKMGRGL